MIPSELVSLQARGAHWKRTLEALKPPEDQELAWNKSMDHPIQRSRLEGALEGASMALLSALACSGQPSRERIGKGAAATLKEHPGGDKLEGVLLPAPTACLIRALALSGKEGGRLALVWLEGEKEEKGSGWRCSSEGVAETSLALKFLAYALWYDRIRRSVAVDLCWLESVAPGHRLASSAPSCSGPLPMASSHTIQGIIQGGGKLLAHSLLGARFVNWFAGRVQDRYNQGATVVINHGWYGIACALSGRDLEAGLEEPSGALKELASQCKALVLELEALKIPGGCLSIKSWRSKGYQVPSRLELTPGICWRSNKQHHKRERDLAPLLLPSLEIGRPNEKGAIAWMFLLFICELRKQAPLLYQGIGAVITLEQASDLLEQAGGPEGRSARRGLARGALEHWSRPEGELEQIGPDRWHIGKACPEVRSFLEEGGRRTLEGRARRG